MITLDELSHELNQTTKIIVKSVNGFARISPLDYTLEFTCFGVYDFNNPKEPLQLQCDFITAISKFADKYSAEYELHGRYGRANPCEISATIMMPVADNGFKRLGEANSMSKLDGEFEVDVVKARGLRMYARLSPAVKEEIKALMLDLINSQPYQKQASMHMIDANTLIKEVEAL